MKFKLLFLSVILLAAFLRLYRLSANPVSLDWDEASLGYNAYSLATTLHDEHGEYLPLARFIAFGDYKPPGYIYADALSVKLLGLSEFSIRFPSALAGIALCLLAYFLAKELSSQRKIGLLSALFVAVSPWSLQFSRAAFEANLATLFSATGIYLFLKWCRTKSLAQILLSALFLVASTYTFNSHRIFAPLIVIALALLNVKTLWERKAQVIMFAGLAIILFLPQIPHLTSREGKLRFTEVAWFNDLKPIELSNQRILADGGGVIPNLLHNRRLVWAEEFLTHYTDHFKGGYLFFSGDINPRLSIQTVGEFYWLDLLPLLLGAYFLFSRQRRIAAILSVWVLLGLVPASLARETPHALRTFTIFPVPQIVLAYGFWFLFKKHRLFALVALGLSLSIFAYLHDYYVHYPIDYDISWQSGYKEMVSAVQKYKPIYPQINITDYYGRPYIYFLLYERYSPQKYWETRNATRDWYGFWTVKGFDHYVFTDDRQPGRQLYVRAPGKSPTGTRLLETIYSYGGHPVFEISASP